MTAIPKDESSEFAAPMPLHGARGVVFSWRWWRWRTLLLGCGLIGVAAALAGIVLALGVPLD